ncbi:MAG: tRNA 2-thiocytidine(32) synthetase TtcA [Clostridia bacterium]|nr:tRNA 2-thiocytidine(32) synthetase TtcA [Clostridia bacterium]
MQKKILGQIRRAIADYQMIEEGDRVVVGVSGGKDSLTLLVALNMLKNFYPKKFELEAVTLTLGIGEFDLNPVKDLCSKIGVNYTIEETYIGKILFEVRQEKNPCSLCANLRRGALHNVAKRLNCNKVALAHHKDDVIETLLMSTFYEGRFHTFSPVTYLKRKELYLIRPLIYTEEKDVKSFIKDFNIKTVPSPCPVNGTTTRQVMKELLLGLQKQNRDIKTNIFGAIKRSHIDEW